MIVFINAKSGGQVGAKILKKLAKLLGQDYVFDLAQGGPEPGYLSTSLDALSLVIML